MLVALLLLAALAVPAYFFWKWLLSKRRRAGGEAGALVDERLARARTETREAVRGHQARLRRFPAAPALAARTPSAADRLVRGFLWGLLLGLAVEAAALVILPYITSGVRSVGL